MCQEPITNYRKEKCGNDEPGVFYRFGILYVENENDEDPNGSGTGFIDKFGSGQGEYGRDDRKDQ